MAGRWSGTRLVVVIAALVLAATTTVACDLSVQTSTPSATVPPRAVDDASVSVDVLWYRPDTGKGGSTDVAITVRPDDTGRFTLNSEQTDVGNTGDEWKASQWAGSVFGILATGADPAKVAIDFRVSDQIDGPSAGAFMTVGVAAAINGDPIDESVSMTGTINPDGSIGPVAGIPEKVQGAKEDGKRKVLIPAGQRMADSEATGTSVDVVALGEEMGVLVEEVGDVHEAYREVTGGQEMSELPPPAEDIEVGAEVSRRLDEHAEEWLDTYGRLAHDFAALPAQLRAQGARLDAQVGAAAAEAAAAESALDEGRSAVAFYRALRAAALQLVTLSQAEAYSALVSGGEAALRNYLDGQMDFRDALTTALEDLLTKTPATVTDVDALVSAYGAVSQGLGDQLASEELLASPALDFDSLADAVAMRARAGLLGALSTDALEILADLPGPAVAAGVDPAAMADLFQGGADANLRVFEVGIVRQIAQAGGISDEQAKALLALKLPDYAAALNQQEVVQLLKDRAAALGSDAPDFSYARLGAALNNYVTAADLIARFYSLQAEIDPQNLGLLADTGNPAELKAMIDTSVDTVRRGIAALEEHGVDASPIAMAFLNARDDAEEGSPEDVMSALRNLWSAQLESRMMAYFGGFPTGAG